MTISSLLQKTTEGQERLLILQEDYGKTTEDNLKLWFKSNVSVLSIMHKNLIKEGRG